MIINEVIGNKFLKLDLSHILLIIIILPVKSANLNSSVQCIALC